MDLGLRAKFEVSSIILTSFIQGGGGGGKFTPPPPPPPPPQNEPLKSSPRLGLKIETNSFNKNRFNITKIVA